MSWLSQRSAVLNNTDLNRSTDLACLLRWSVRSPFSAAFAEIHVAALLFCRPPSESPFTETAKKKSFAISRNFAKLFLSVPFLGEIHSIIILFISADRAKVINFH